MLASSVFRRRPAEDLNDSAAPTIASVGPSCAARSEIASELPPGPQPNETPIPGMSSVIMQNERKPERDPQTNTLHRCRWIARLGNRPHTGTARPANCKITDRRGG